VGLGAAELELSSRRLLLSGKIEAGWAALREAFALDESLHCAYGEGDEEPASAEQEKALLARRFEGKLPNRLLIAGLRGAESPAGLAWRGVLKRRALDYAAAVEDLKRAKPAADVLTWLGEAELQTGDDKNGRKHLAAATKRKDSKPWNLAWQGRVLLTLKRDPSGLEPLSRAIAARPQEHLFYAWRGIARLRFQDERALSDFDKALALGKGKDARWIRGWRAQALPPEKALAALQASAKELPGYGPVASALARALRAAGRWTEWIDALDKAARIDAKHVHGLRALDREGLEKLDADLSKAAGPAARRWRGRVLTLLGRPLEALPLLAGPDELSSLWRGEALCACGRPEEGLRALPRDAFSARAKALVALGRLPEALASLETAVSADHGDASAWADLGALRLLADRPKDAVQALELAVAKAPDHVDAWTDLSAAARRLGRPADAARRLKKAEALNQSQARARLAQWKRHWESLR
jgi:tetratricopeptide (TPR) repeat protein